MSKILRLFTVSLILASIMIATVAGGVFAAGGGDQVQQRSCACDFENCDGDGPPWLIE